MCIRREIKNTVKHCSSFMLAERESQNDWKVSQETTQHNSEMSRYFLALRSSIRNCIALFKPGTDI